MAFERTPHPGPASIRTGRVPLFPRYLLQGLAPESFSEMSLQTYIDVHTQKEFEAAFVLVACH